MWAEFKHALRRLRGQIIGWSIGLAIYSFLMASLYDSIQSIEGFEEMIQNYPPELMAFFGEMMEITTPKGYLDTYFFTYMPIIIGIFALMVGARLLAGDEEKGILDLVLAQPISRTALVIGRYTAFLLATVIILAVSWLSWVVPAGNTGLDLTAIEFFLPFLPLFAVLVLFGSFALLLSMLLPSARMAGFITGGLLVANWLLLGLSNINDSLESLVRFTPLNYYQSGQAISDMNWAWFAGLLGVSALFFLASWLLFRRRDIRVGGERSWSLPSLRRSAAAG
ncbi:MAG: ABC transporter permease subunit [Anaerolineales bacterium]|nr:ABC transporter permease subunit [Anaerolineales bacterium]